MLRLILFIIFYLLSIAKTMAQDPLFSQNVFVPSILNPAFASIEASSSAGIVNRLEWSNLDLKIQSKYTFVSMHIQNSSIGITIVDQRQNFTKYSYTQFDGNYAYRVQISDDWYFHPTITIRYGVRAFDSSRIYLEDQINIVNGVISPISSENLSINDTFGFLDFSSRLLLKNENHFYGTALKHLNIPNVSFLTGRTIPLDMFITINLGYQFDIAKYVDSFHFYIKLKLNSNYFQQVNIIAVNVGGALVFPNYFIGRNISSNFSKSIALQKILSLGYYAGLNHDHFQFGYPYDYNNLKSTTVRGV